MRVTSVIYGIAATILILFGLQYGIFGAFGIGKQYLGHRAVLIVAGICAIIVALAHIPLFGAPSVFVEDFAVQTNCRDHDGKSCTKGSAGCKCTSTGCTRNDGSGNQIACQYPKDNGIDSCKACMPGGEGFEGVMSGPVVVPQPNGKPLKVVAEQSGAGALPAEGAGEPSGVESSFAGAPFGTSD